MLEYYCRVLGDEGNISGFVQGFVFRMKGYQVERYGVSCFYQGLGEYLVVVIQIFYGRWKKKSREDIFVFYEFKEV